MCLNMNKTLLLSVFLVLLHHQFHWISAQVHYVPAQIFIPTFTNVSHYNATSSTHNNSTRNNTNNWPFIGVGQNRTGFWNGTTPEGHLIVGSIGLYDRLIFNQEFFKARRWWSSREKIVEYPYGAYYGKHETISAIRVYNRFYDGLDCSATIVKGGVGYQYVKIRLASNWGKGFKYLVQIFGR